MTQGVSHLERGQNFERVLVNELGGMPAVQTIDYIEGVSHDGGGMVNSPQGLEKVRVSSVINVHVQILTCSSSFSPSFRFG